jgi:hypothetical protein
MRWHAVLMAVLVTATIGCGRFGFERSDEDAGDSDAKGDGMLGDGPRADVAAACAFDLCDGFETPTLDTSLWTVFGNVTRDTSQFHRGAASMRMHVDARNVGQSGFSILSETRTFSTSPSTVWVRAWLRFASLPAGSNGMELVALQAMSPDEGVYVFLNSGDLELYNQLTGASTSNGTTPPLDTWFCIVWKIVLSTTNTGSLDMTSDVVPGITMSNVQTDSSPRLQMLSFGAGFASGNVNVAQPAFDMWLDDVLVDTNALTCTD